MRTILQFALLALMFCAGSLVHAAPPDIGDVPPDEVGVTAKGEPLRLSAFAGKAVVLSYWATWCSYCLKELPILVNIQNKVGKDRLRVIAINTEDWDTFRTVSRLLKSLDLQLGYDPNETGQKAYGVKGIPHLVIIGRDGKVVRVYRGYSESSLPAIAADLNVAIRATPANDAAGVATAPASASAPASAPAPAPAPAP
jgi:thiol-disulfide isomerase/thioredoxin